MAAPAIFMIEGGRALELVKAHIAEVKRVNEVNNALCRELGVKRGVKDAFTGRLTAVQFPGKVHPDFKQPARNGASYPKKGSAWAARLAANKGYEMVGTLIERELKVPCFIEYTLEGGRGSRTLGLFTPCGFLYLGEDGPYAMWVPDVPAEVAHDEAQGHQVAEPAKSFRMEFDGCRRILKEEWELLVAQRRLADKQAGVATEDDDA